MSVAAIALTVGCSLAVVALLVAESRAWRGAVRVLKTLASALFILVAVSLHATSSTYGQIVLIALSLSAIGDICLLSGRSFWFLSGLGFFLLAHIAFSAGFALSSFSTQIFAAAAAFMSVVGVVTLRWLWSHLRSLYKVAVAVYVVAIGAMCSLALVHSNASHSWLTALGALAFAASDISVARDRFVASSFLNRAWGLPLYYIAQLLLAWSVAQ